MNLIIVGYGTLFGGYASLFTGLLWRKKNAKIWGFLGFGIMIVVAIAVFLLHFLPEK